MRPVLLQNKYRAFAAHQARLEEAPDPVSARRFFLDRVRRARRAQQLQGGFYMLIYLSAITAALAVVVRYGGPLAEWLGLSFLSAVLAPIAAFASSLTVVGVVGLVLCRRFLGMMDVDLFYYSLESTLAARPARKASAESRPAVHRTRPRGRGSRTSR